MAGVKKRQQTSEEMLALAAWVKDRRAALGFRTQAELTDVMQSHAPDGVDVTTSYVGNLEAGRTGIPRQPYLGLLALALKVSQVEILRQAGLITEPDSAPPPVRIAQPFERGTPHAKVVELLHELDDDAALQVARFCQFQIDTPVVDVPVIVSGKNR